MTWPVCTSNRGAMYMEIRYLKRERVSFKTSICCLRRRSEMGQRAKCTGETRRVRLDGSAWKTSSFSESETSAEMWNVAIVLTVMTCPC